MSAEGIWAKLFCNKTRDEIVRKYGPFFYASNLPFIKDCRIFLQFMMQIHDCLHSKQGILLDLGSGFGLHSLAFSEMGYEVISLDISKELMRVHKMLISECDRKIVCHPVLGDALNLPFRDRSIEIVYTNQFISHVTNLSKSISQICRVLKTGGELILSDVDRISLLSFRISLGRKKMDKRFMEMRKEVIRSFLKEKDYALTEHEIEALASQTSGLVRREVEEIVCEFVKGRSIKSIVKKFSRREPFYRKFGHRSPYGQYDERLFTPADINKLLENGFTNIKHVYVAPPRLSRFLSQRTLLGLQRSVSTKRLLLFMVGFLTGQYVVYGLRT